MKLTIRPHIVLMLRMTVAKLPLPLITFLRYYPSTLWTVCSNVDTRMTLSLKVGNTAHSVLDHTVYFVRTTA